MGRLAREVTQNHSAALGANAAATFILGGQIGEAPPDILLVYPEGNYIRASDDRPFLQIGESKYGKFMLDIAVIAHTDLVTSLKIALGSMMSTARANLSVGPPYDAAVYRNDAFDLDEHRFTAESPVLGELREVWERNILNAVGQLPDVGLSELRADGESGLGLVHIRPPHLLEGAPQDPRDVHLRDAHPLRDLVLREIGEEPEVDDLALAVVEPGQAGVELGPRFRPAELGVGRRQVGLERDDARRRRLRGRPVVHAGPCGEVGEPGLAARLGPRLVGQRPQPRPELLHRLGQAQAG